MLYNVEHYICLSRPDLYHLETITIFEFGVYLQLIVRALASRIRLHWERSDKLDGHEAKQLQIRQSGDSVLRAAPHQSLSVIKVVRRG